MFPGRPETGNIGVSKRRARDMSDTQFDQTAWFERIGYSGPVSPTLETLNRLIFAHSHSIAYETLDIMLGRPPKLDVPTLQHKMIVSKRGGYCLRTRSDGNQVTTLTHPDRARRWTEHEPCELAYPLLR